jgi:hypothetical protein
MSPLMLFLKDKTFTQRIEHCGAFEELQPFASPAHCRAELKRNSGGCGPPASATAGVKANVVAFVGT